MKKIKLLLLMVLPFMMYGQEEIEYSKNFDVKAGSPYKVIDAKSKEYFYNDEGGIVAVKTDGEDVFIQMIDAKTQKEKSRKEYNDFPKRMQLQKVAKFGERLFYFYAVYDKKSKRESVYVREIDMNNGTFKKAVLLFKTSYVVLPQSSTENIGFWGFGRGPKFEFHSSFDNSKLMIQYRLKPTTKRDKNSYDKLGFYIFDKSDLSKIWGKEINMPYTEKDMNNIAYTVSNEGNAYMISYRKEQKVFDLLEITADTKTISKNPIKLDGNLFFSKIIMKEDSKGNLNCIGYYANGVDVKFDYFGGGLIFIVNVNGILQFSMNKSGSIESENKVDFPKKIISQFESKRQQAKNDKREDKGKLGISDLVLREVIENEDGTSLVIGEQYYTRTKSSGSSTTTYFYYEDMVATKISKDGDVLWMKKLPKLQYGTKGRGGMSFKYARKGDNIYLMFLDNIKNIALTTDETPKKHKDGKGGFLTAYKLNDETGDVEKLSILDTRDIDGINAYQFNTARLLFANEDQLYLEVYIKGKKDSMIKIELEK